MEEDDGAVAIGLDVSKVVAGEGVMIGPDEASKVALDGRATEGVVIAPGMTSAAEEDGPVTRVVKDDGTKAATVGKRAR